jgi:hypothetical protein
MFAFAHMLKFFSNKLASLCRRSLTLFGVAACPFDYFFFRQSNTSAKNET